MSTLRTLVLVALASAILCLPALINGQAFFFPDTTAYMRGPDMAATKLLGPQFASEWTQAPSAAAVTTGPATPGERAESEGAGSSAATAATAPAPTPAEAEKPIWKGRSVYYGALVYLGHLFGGFWFSVIAQGALLAGTALIALRHAGLKGNGTYLAAISGLTALTSAGLYVGMLMPDLLAGLVILAGATLVAVYGRLSWFERLFLTAILAFGALSHTTCLLLVLGLLAVAIVWMLIRTVTGVGRVGLMPVGLLAVAFGGAVAGDVVFDAVVEKATGQAPIHMPIVMAELLEGEVGLRVLDEQCAADAAAYVTCQFRDRLPMPSDQFLFADDPARGVFNVVDGATQRAISGEQTRFVMAALARYPVEIIAWRLTLTGEQLTRFRVKGFNYTGVWRDHLETRVPQSVLSTMQNTLAYQGRVPTAALSTVHYVVVLLSLAAIAAGLVNTPFLTRADPQVRMLVLLLIIGVVGNALVCAALAGVFERFQARVVWVLPLTAIALEAYLWHAYRGGVVGLLFGRIRGRNEVNVA